MVKLKRLKINRYRNVEPCELRFSDRFNVLLGPNGAGKTTLLEMISNLLRTNLDDGSEPFSFEVELALSDASVTCKIERDEYIKPVQSELPLEVHALSAGFSDVRLPKLELQLSRADLPKSIEVRWEYQIPLPHDGSASNRLIHGPHGATGLLGSATLVAARQAGGNAAGEFQHAIRNASRFDESLDMFRAITARQDDVANLRPKLVSAKFEEGSGKVVGIGGIVWWILENVVARHLVEGATDVAIGHERLHFLSEAVRLLGLKAATAKFELIGKQVQKGPLASVEMFSNLKFWLSRRDGSVFQDHQLSYGQKRLLTFLYYLDANPSFVIADELVNGLHHAWIEECVKAIGDRQAFLTSQNPLLLDYLSFDSVEQVKETFILCRTEPDGDRDKMIWRNMKDDEAEMFYSAYKVGIEHVGEILRNRGLW